VADVAAAGAAVPVVVAAAPLLEVPDPEPVAEEPALADAAPGGGGHPAGGLLPGGGFLPGAGGGGQFTAPVVAVGLTPSFHRNDHPKDFSPLLVLCIVSTKIHV